MRHGAGQAPPALTLGGNALLSCSFPACPGGPKASWGSCVSRSHPSPAALAKRRWLLLLSLLTLALFPSPSPIGGSYCCPGAARSELRIPLELRPRALLALRLAGALACNGAVLQVMLHKPVAELACLASRAALGWPPWWRWRWPRGSGSICQVGLSLAALAAPRW